MFQKRKKTIFKALSVSLCLIFAVLLLAAVTPPTDAAASEMMPPLQPTPTPTIPPFLTGKTLPATGITSTNAMFNGEIIPGMQSNVYTSTFEYWESSQPDKTIIIGGSEWPNRSYYPSLRITGLKPDTEYSYRVLLDDYYTLHYKANIVTFKTLPESGSIPTPTPILPSDGFVGYIKSASKITSTSALLDSTIYIIGSRSVKAYYEYKPNRKWITSYMKTDSLITNQTADFPVEIKGLEPGTDYIFRLIIKENNPNGENIYVHYVGDWIFTTQPARLNKISGYIKPDLPYDESVFPHITSGFKVSLEGTNFSASTDNGYFVIPNVPERSSSYTLKISKPNYLTRTITGLNLNGNDLVIGSQNAPLDIWAGDMMVDGVQDNAINMSDIMEIIELYNSSEGDGKYEEARDLNMDKAINMADIMVIITHFNTSIYPLPVGYGGAL
ncbi:MAG: hypothetical protein N2645_01290 [Clostridia bacterium]|nr:hypothetical protein [Clostridia bacterium]